MTTYILKLSEQQLKIIQDSVDHLVEVDLEYMEYSEEEKKESIVLQGLLKLVEPDGMMNSLVL